MVGWADTASGPFHAFLYDGGTMFDLLTLVVSGGTGWTLSEATAINDQGWIVGYGTNPDGGYTGLSPQTGAAAGGGVALWRGLGGAGGIRQVASRLARGLAPTPRACGRTNREMCAEDRGRWCVFHRRTALSTQDSGSLCAAP